MSVNLNLGCGEEYLPDYWGLDLRSGKNVHVLCDLNTNLPFRDACTDKIRAKSILEHIETWPLLLQEAKRILKPGGTFSIYVPHWSNPFYYSDYTHRRFFGLLTFDYFSVTDRCKYHRVPHYSDLQVKILSVRLLFDSPFKLFRWPLKALQILVNLHPDWQLFYEYHLASVIPCYAIETVLQF